MNVNPSLFNQLTNAAGGFIGIPDIVQGVMEIVAGNYPVGAYHVGKGIVEFIAFYFMGK